MGNQVSAEAAHAAATNIAPPPECPMHKKDEETAKRPSECPVQQGSGNDISPYNMVRIFIYL